LGKVGELDYCLYDFEIYPCAYVKTLEMHSKVSVFATGKLISVGAKIERHAAEDLLAKRARLDTILFLASYVMKQITIAEF
jgi:TATA-box binding protein (TBP) (component of TFIID and TFIIIB)